MDGGRNSYYKDRLPDERIRATDKISTDLDVDEWTHGRKSVRGGLVKSEVLINDRYSVLYGAAEVFSKSVLNYLLP